ncbi:MAG TPA: tol-pal system protein YbgF [Gallionella sp.]|nr:tol-pal system protein YbgF [Gallionella sp.]
MLKPRALFLSLSILCFAAPAQAGLFSDDEARDQIKQLDARVKTEQDAIRQQIDSTAEQQTRTVLDMQGQIDALRNEIRVLRGQNEELTHGLQDAEKREKDFYVDLDTRLRQLETAAKEKAAQEKAAQEKTAQAENNQPVAAAAASFDPNDPVQQNRAYEAAYAVFKSGNAENTVKAFQEFLKKYPDSVYAPNANYWLGDAQFALQDYRGALETYQNLLKADPNYPRAADVMFNIAGCQQELKQDAAAQKTLKQLIAKHPRSEAAAKARKLLGIKK